MNPGRLLLCLAGFTSVGLGTLGLFLPLLPTVPFLLLAAFCFARSNPKLEAWLLEHPRFGPHLQAWRRSRSISRGGKRAAWTAFSISAATGLVVLPGWWSLVPLGIAAAGIVWIAALPTAPVARARPGGAG